MYFILQGFLLVGVSAKVPPKVYFKAPKKCSKMVPKWLQNGSQHGPRKAARGSPKTTWGPCVVPGAPAGSRALLLKAFVCCWFCFALVCVFGFGFGFLCVLLFLFVHSFVLYVFMCACFWLCVLFPVVVFLFYAFVFAMFEDCLTNSRATSKRHATCSRMSPSGLVEMLIRLECVGSAPVVMVPL